MLSFFLNLAGILKPVPFDIHDFCEKVFSEVREDPSHDVGVTEIRHYKETDNVEHEFLLADIADPQGQQRWTLRLERSAAIDHRPTTFFTRLTQISSSILPAKDTVWIASSDKQLIDGMERGPSFRIARLPFSRKPFPLRELCLILSFFPAFSPKYKLREEQCYWFCDVVLKTIVVAYEGVSIVEERNFKKAGRFGRLSVTLSPSTRQRFIDAYKAVHTLGESCGSNASSPKLPPLEAMPVLLALLEVPSTEAKIRAINTITTLAKCSPQHRYRLVDTGAVSGLLTVIDTSPSMADRGMVALKTITGETEWPDTLNTASVAVKSAYLMLASQDPTLSAKAAQELITSVLAEDSNQIQALTALTSINLFKTSEARKSAAIAINSYLQQTETSIVHGWIVSLSNRLSSHSWSADTQRRTADFLVTVIQGQPSSEAALLHTNLSGMLSSESEGLKTLILDTLCDLPYSSVAFEKELLNANCLPILEQLFLAHGRDDRPLYCFYRVCRGINRIYPHDPRLPGHLLWWAKQGENTSRSYALAIIIALAPSQRFSDDICEQGAARILTGLRGGVVGPYVAGSVCALSRWSFCRFALWAAGLIPSAEDSHDGPISLEVITTYLQDRFPRWTWQVEA